MNPSQPERSFFESYNARALRPDQVARHFVPPAAFAQLIQRRHTVILGPRGSGKTTLLKMLQPAALDAWDRQEAIDFKRRVEFSGVFVPFDRSWRAQIDAHSSTGNDDVERILASAAFATHSFRGLVSTMWYRVAGRLGSNPNEAIEAVTQAQLADALYATWGLPRGARSLLGVRAALGAQLTKIGGDFKKLSTRTPPTVRDLDPAYFIPFLQGISNAIDQWEAVTGKMDERWALAFDELELAPSTIKAEIFRAMRSVDSRLLLKIALSPFDIEVPFSGGPTDPQAGQDYDLIALWASDKRGVLPFCTRLWDELIAEKGHPGLLPRQVFGRGHFETDESEWKKTGSRSAYGVDGRLARSFAALAEQDKSFAEYMKSRGYSARELDRIPPKSRAADIRKISPLVTARLFFNRAGGREAGESATSRRARKSLTLYTGWDTICALTEGNPRWFIGVVTELLANSRGEKPSVAPRDQARAISALAERYAATLRMIPTGEERGRRSAHTLISLLEKIGDYFRFQQFDAPFSAEPPGSVIADSDLSEEVCSLVGRAVNAGALVTVTGSGEAEGLSDVRGNRFRLCYLLVAYSRAMPRLGRAVHLSRVIRESASERVEQSKLSL